MKPAGTSVRRRFPGALRDVRVRRGLLQKAVAADLGIDQALLCAVEKGARSPFNEDRLQSLAISLNLNSAERRMLGWAAHHDRLLIQLEAAGASIDELEAISATLSAMNNMDESQRQGWLVSVRRLDESAALLRSVASASATEEAAMT